MKFFLQFRHATSDQPLLEVTSPLPLQVPRRGDEIELYLEADPEVKVTGRVECVRWAYQPSPALPGAPGTLPSLDILARVFLIPR